MKNLLKSAIGAVVLAGAMSPAMAEVVTVGGVTFDTADTNFRSHSDSISQSISATPDGLELSGHGYISIVGESRDFCSGCELTFVYGGYTNPGTFDPTDPPMDSGVAFTGGWVEVYVDYTPNFSIGDASSASDGDLWLSLVGADVLTDDATLEVFFNQGGAAGLGLLNVDVNGGLADSYFDTNSFAGGADLQFTTSFPQATGYTRGSGDIVGNPAAVPEPATLGLLGLGLIGSAFAGRRRKV